MFGNFTKDKSKKWFILAFIILAVILVSYVLFRYPQPGVADQGDFDRVMGPAGLKILESDAENKNFIRFFKYTVTNYGMFSYDGMFINVLLGSSIGYIIVLIKFLCKIFNQEVFKTQYLALVYSIMYISAFAVILKNLNIKNKIKLSILGILILFVFFDGNYLVWFNSLYGEPMILTTLMLLTASILYYINCRYRDENSRKTFLSIILVFAASFMFLGSKLQVISALPFIFIFLLKIIFDNRKELSKYKMASLILLLIVVCAYPLRISAVSKGLSRDTQYNSVFYGVLNGSSTPEQDLKDLGLNPDMAVEAGKHAYLNKEEYVKYVPRTEITEKEFYNKISNFKLAKFYITHPLRFLKGMEYTASNAFKTSTSLGMYSRDYSEKPITNFDRFVNWSKFRESKMPKNLLFIVSVFLIVFIISLLEYRKGNKLVKNTVMLLWMIMCIGAVQFPMPFMGNGRADTAKQLYLFNFVFDIILLISVFYIFSTIYDIIKTKSRR